MSDKELVSTPPSGVTSTEGSDLGSIPTTNSPDSPGSAGRLSRRHPGRQRSSTLRSLPSWDQLTKLHLKKGPMASIPFFTAPVSAATRFDPQYFRVLLLRRLWCQLPLSSATRQCGQPLDSRDITELVPKQGCRVAEGFPWRVALPGSAEKQVPESPRTSGFMIWTFCWCQGWTTVALEVVADGLSLFHGSQLAIDTTMVSVVRADGAPRRQCAGRDGAALDQARRTKELRYPELSGDQGRARWLRDRREVV